MTDLRVEETSLAELAGTWPPLAEAHGAGLPFRTFEWTAAWLDHFPARRLAVHDRPMLLALRSRDGALAGVAPLQLTHRPRGAPLLRSLDFIGTDPNVTELRGLVCDPALEPAAIRALLDHLRARGGEWDWLHLRGIRVGSEAERLVAAEPGVTWERQEAAYVLPLPATWDELRASVSRNLRESLRHGYNSLRRDGHAFSLEVARTPQAIAPALERFFELHALRAGREDTLPHPDVFASPPARAFLRDVCARLGQRDMVRVFELKIEGEVVATRLAFAMGRVLYLYYSGYRPEWSRYGVMTTAVAEAVLHAMERGFRQVHLSIGTDVSKTRWRPLRLLARDAVLVGPSARARAALGLHQGLHRLEGAPRPSLLRRLLGRGPGR